MGFLFGICHTTTYDERRRDLLLVHADEPQNAGSDQPPTPAVIVEETPRGVWRRCTHADGSVFKEFRSHATLFGLPLVHMTRG